MRVLLQQAPVLTAHEFTYHDALFYARLSFWSAYHHSPVVTYPE